MKEKNLKEKPEKTKPKGYRYISKEKENKIKLYNLRGELLGELVPGGKVDFQSLLRKGPKTKRY